MNNKEHLEHLYDDVTSLLHDLIGFINKQKYNDKISAEDAEFAESLINRSQKQISEITVVTNKSYVQMSNGKPVIEEELATYVEAEDVLPLPPPPLLEIKKPDIPQSIRSTPIVEPIQCNTTEEICPFQNSTFGELSECCLRQGELYRKERFAFVLHKKTLIHVILIEHWLLIYENSKKDSTPVNLIDVMDYVAQEKKNDDDEKNQIFEIVAPGKKTYEFISKTYKEMMQWITAVNNKKICSNTVMEPKVVDNELIQTDTDLSTEFEIYENPDEIIDSVNAPTLPPRNPNSVYKFRKSFVTNSNQYNNLTNQGNNEEELVIYDELQESEVVEETCDMKAKIPDNTLLSAAAKYDTRLPVVSNVQSYEGAEDEEFYDEILEFKKTDDETSSMAVESINNQLNLMVDDACEEYEEPVFNRGNENGEENQNHLIESEVIYDDLLDVINTENQPNNTDTQPVDDQKQNNNNLDDRKDITKPVEEEDLIYDDMGDVNLNKNEEMTNDELQEYDEIFEMKPTVEISSPEKPPTKPKPVISPKPKVNNKFSEKFSKKFTETTEQTTENTSPKKLKPTIIQKMERSLSFASRK